MSRAAPVSPPGPVEQLVADAMEEVTPDDAAAEVVLDTEMPVAVTAGARLEVAAATSDSWEPSIMMTPLKKRRGLVERIIDNVEDAMSGSCLAAGKTQIRQGHSGSYNLLGVVNVVTAEDSTAFSTEVTERRLHVLFLAPPWSERSTGSDHWLIGPGAPHTSPDPLARESPGTPRAVVMCSAENTSEFQWNLLGKTWVDIW